jgi:hypothetical protein
MALVCSKNARPQPKQHNDIIMFRSPLRILASALLAAFLSTASAQPSVVGIRLVFTEPTEDASCTPEEHGTIVSIMHDGILELMEDDSRMLGIFDDGTAAKPDPLWCKRACRGFAPGSCFV